MKTQDEVAKSAEMCVIGAILIDEKALVNVMQTLKPEHFYFDELKAAYQAIWELSSEGCVTALDKPRSNFFRKSMLEARGFSKFAENGSQFCAASGRCSKADEQEKTQRLASRE